MSRQPASPSLKTNRNDRGLESLAAEAPVMAKDYAVPVMAKDHVVRVMAKDYAAPATSTLHAALSVLVGRVLAGRVLAGIWVLKTQNAMPRRSKDNANF